MACVVCYGRLWQCSITWLFRTTQPAENTECAGASSSKLPGWVHFSKPQPHLPPGRGAFAIAAKTCCTRHTNPQAETSSCQQFRPLCFAGPCCEHGNHIFKAVGVEVSVELLRNAFGDAAVRHKPSPLPSEASKEVEDSSKAQTGVTADSPQAFQKMVALAHCARATAANELRCVEAPKSTLRMKRTSTTTATMRPRFDCSRHCSFLHSLVSGSSSFTGVCTWPRR